MLYVKHEYMSLGHTPYFDFILVCEENEVILIHLAVLNKHGIKILEIVEHTDEINPFPSKKGKNKDFFFF